MKKMSILSVVMMALLTIGCGGNGDGDNTDIPKVQAPKLVSISPADGTTEVPVGDVSVKLTYDQNITFLSVSASQINVSGGTVKTARAMLKELLLTLNCPEKGTTVAVAIPKGLVKNTQGSEAEAVSFSFTTTKPNEPSMGDISKTPLTQNPAAVRLYQYFYEQYGKKMISSVMANVNWNNECADKVYKLTGKYPAMNCYDFIHIYFSPANWIDYTKIDPVRKWVDAGGIVQLMWHFNVPYDEAGSKGTSDWNARPESTTFKGSNALKEGTWEHKVFYEQMDKVVATLLKLQEAGIAATWRPFHEAAGNATAKQQADWTKAWFWWGAEGAEVEKQLWIAMYDYFKQKGVNNLIWIWTTQNCNGNSSQFNQDTDWYPGDQYVDMVGRDLYGRSAQVNAQEFAEVQAAYPNKMIALSECGQNNGQQPGLISSCWTQGALWSHFMVWYQGDYGSTGTMANDDWWKDAMKASCVITRDQLPNLK